MNGTRQLIDIVLGTFPTPIQPPDHGALPKAQDTCVKCHSARRPRVRGPPDEDVVLGGRGEHPPVRRPDDPAARRRRLRRGPRASTGTSWRTCSSPPARSNAPVIDYVKASRDTGEVKEYIAQDKITDAENVQPDIDAIKAAEPLTTMTCYDCHNRVGPRHRQPALRAGLQAVHRRHRRHAPVRQARGDAGPVDRATRTSRRRTPRSTSSAEFYKTNYPDVVRHEAGPDQRGDRADQGAVPADVDARDEGHGRRPIRTTWATSDFPGCFRCHDGGHFLVVDGVATKQVIPSTCDTCHTFPQIGPAVASLPLGEPPSTHTTTTCGCSTTRT